MAPAEIVSKKKPCVNFAMDIIESYDQRETTYWDMNMKMGEKSPLVVYYPVNKTSEEGAKIVNYIEMKASSSKYAIDGIWRIQNPYLMASFLLAKEELVEEQGAERVQVQSRLMLHGTNASNVDGIALENFDLTEDNIKRHRYGHGVNFTTDIIFASKFCHDKPKKTLIVANVIVAKTCVGHKEMIVPTGDSDTSINKTDKGQNVIVKYDDDTFYPAYKVEYRCSAK